MRTLLISFLSGVLILSFSACQRRFVYAASKLHTPMLQQKGDSRINASFSFGNAKGLGDSSRNKGVDVQAAYAVTKNLGVMFSHYKRNESDVFYSDRTSPFIFSYVHYKRDVWEGGAGYLITTEEKSPVTFGVYGGVAFGRLKITDAGMIDDTTSYTRNFTSRLQKFFIQPGLTLGKIEKAKFDLSIRFNFLQHRDVKTNYTIPEAEDFRLNNLESSFQFFIEPSFAFQIPIPGTNWLRLESSASSMFHSTNRSVRVWSMSVGITADPRRLFKK